MSTTEELIKGCIKGRADAQRLLFARYAPLIKGTLLRYIKDKELAADLLQDSFIKIFNNLKKYNYDGVFEGWLRRIAVNTALDALNKQKKRIDNEALHDNYDDSEDTIETDEESLVELMMKAGYDKQTLVQMLENLQEKYRIAFSLFYIDELSHKEIAEALAINEAQSRKWVFRAKEMVKQQMMDYLALRGMANSNFKSIPK